jgi:hypothetical protein
LDGQKLQPGTTKVTLPVNDESHKLVGEAEDYESETLLFKVTKDDRLKLELSPVKSTGKTKRTVGGGRRVAPPSAAGAAEGPGAPATNAAPPAKTPTESCDNPFYLDAQGIKRVRPGCL